MTGLTGGVRLLRSPAMRRWRAGLFMVLLGCGPEVEDAPEAAESPPAETVVTDDAPPTEVEAAAPAPTLTEAEAAQETGRPALRAGPLGDRVLLDDRSRSRSRSAIRRRVGARPTLVTALHHRREDRSTTTLVTFTASYVERCVTRGTPRDECTLAQGEGSLARDRGPCVFGGIARVDIGPPRGEREGAVDLVGLQLLGDWEICVFEVEGLSTSDEDGDGQPEIVLSYAWADLRYQPNDLTREREGSAREVYRADMTRQVRLETRAYQHRFEDERNLVTQLRRTDEGLALDVIDWLGACPDRSPPWGQVDCDVQQRTIAYAYDAQRDLWRVLESADAL